MIGNLATALTPVGIALGIVAASFGICVLLGKGIKRADDTSGWPSWLADLDLGDDGADTKRTPATEAAQRQALAIANSPTVARAVVDELAQRRAVQS